MRRWSYQIYNRILYVRNLIFTTTLHWPWSVDRHEGSEILRLGVSLLDLGALLLLAVWMYLFGIPDWTTQTGAIIIGSTVLLALNLGYLLFWPAKHSPKTGASAGYASALAAIAVARKASVDDFRRSTMSTLYDTASPLGSLSSERLIEAASLLQRRGEYEKVLAALADAPVALEIMYLAGKGNAAGNDDAMIRLEGLLAFIHAREPEDHGVEIMEMADVRLDALYQDAVFEMAPDYGHDILSSQDEPKAPSRDIDYEDVVNATLRIVSIEKISAIPLMQRRALFSRVRNIMEKSGSLPNADQVEEIKAWVSANSN